jgi:hypothetical protein
MLKYKLQFSNFLNEDYTIFFDQKSYTGDVTQLIGTDGAFSVKSLNNDDDPFSPILSREATISFHVPISQSVSIEDFLATEDDEWAISVFRDLGQPSIFKGYLLVEDSSQELHDRPYEITSPCE